MGAVKRVDLDPLVREDGQFSPHWKGVVPVLGGGSDWYPRRRETRRRRRSNRVPRRAGPVESRVPSAWSLPVDVLHPQDSQGVLPLPLYRGCPIVIYSSSDRGL